MSLSDDEREFVRQAQASSGLPSTIKDCLVLARLTGKTPEEVLTTKREINGEVNEEYPKL
jgi:hypothetical protein